MKGDRKIPTNTFMASADQLEPTFFRICAFSYFRIGSGLSRFSRPVLRDQFLKVGRIAQPLFDQVMPSANRTRYS
jgi:hypothetical protein